MIVIALGYRRIYEHPITDSAGFVGRNLAENLKSIRDGKIRTCSNIHIDNINEYDPGSTPEQLDAYCTDADFVFNLAGVNRNAI